MEAQPLIKVVWAGMNKSLAGEIALKIALAMMATTFSSSVSTGTAFRENRTLSDETEPTKIEETNSQPKELVSGQSPERELHSGEPHSYRLPLKIVFENVHEYPFIASCIENEARQEQVQIGKAQLTLGQPVDRQLQPGENHDYFIPLKAGEYAQVSIDQLKIDVSYTIYDPHGKTIATINWEDQGAPEPLWLAADESGDYRLAITGLTVRGANARYIATLARVGELETAPSADQTYVKAYRLFFRAEELSDKKDNESIRKAVEAYEQALPLWRSLKDRIGEAYTLYGLGFVLSNLGENVKAIESYKQAIEIWHGANNHQRDEANSLHDLAMTEPSFTERIATLKKEQELRRLLNDSKGQALVLSNMG